MFPKKNVLIAGASGGIGEAIARLLAEKSMQVFGTYFHQEPKAKQIEKELDSCRMFFCDLTSPRPIQEITEKILSDYGNLDTVINAVSPPLKVKLFEEITPEEFQEDLNAILKGAYNLFHAVIPAMKRAKQGTLISLLSSVVSNPVPRLSSYVAAKSGLYGLSQSLALEVSRFGIRVLTLSPTFVETPLLQAFPAKLIEMEAEKQTGGTLLRPEEIARLIFRMMDSPAEYPNGKQVTLLNRQDLPTCPQS